MPHMMRMSGFLAGVVAAVEYPRVVLIQSWAYSRAKVAVLIGVQLVAAVSSILAPSVLGIGVGAIASSPETGNVLVVVLVVAAVYTLCWAFGNIVEYLVYPLYGEIEQSVQTQIMSTSLSASYRDPRPANTRPEVSEISFAIDGEAEAFRTALSTLILTITPALFAFASGFVALLTLNSWREAAIMVVGVLLYVVVSRRGVIRHQRLQRVFFERICAVSVY